MPPTSPLDAIRALGSRLSPLLTPEEAETLQAALDAVSDWHTTMQRTIERLERKIAASKQGFDTAVATYRSLLETFQTFRRTTHRILQMSDLDDLPDVLEGIRLDSQLTLVRVVLDADLFGPHLSQDIPAVPSSILLDHIAFLEDQRGHIHPYIGPTRQVTHPGFFLGLDLPGRGSCVIFPLRHKYDERRVIGIFSALDTDPERFTRTKATDFLDHFCAILAASLVTALEHAELDALTVRDPLTGIHNRTYLHRHGPRLLDLARRKHHPLQLLFLDLDGFKAVNDRLGHDVGDLVLIQVAQTMARMVRSYDLCVRLGGDEFAILMPESTLEDALALARRLQEAILGLDIPAITRGHNAVRVSVSIGIAAWQPEWDIDELLRQADMAMYAAKTRRRETPLSLTTPPSTAENT